MHLPHLVEVMDLHWPPASLHATLREILECGNSRPFRPYYDWVARETARRANEGGFKNVVEVGAGTAPISRRLARDSTLNGIRIIVCDDHPDRATYQDLANRYRGRLEVKYQPVDFSQPQPWPERTLLLVSGSFHHVPPKARAKVLEHLSASGAGVMVCEPLRKSAISMFFVFFSIFPALLLPLWFFNRPGKLRRFFWCWLVPVAPLIFWWDGLVSCLRMWTGKQWASNLRSLFGSEREPTIRHSTFSQMVAW